MNDLRHTLESTMTHSLSPQRWNIKLQCGFRLGWRTLDQLFVLLRIFKGVWEFEFVDLEKAFDRLEYRVFGPLLRAIWSLYNYCRSSNASQD